MMTFIVLLGPPGAGKGTQADILARKTGLAHISSGDLFRENIKNQTSLGKKAKTFMDKGDLVPDEVTISMIRARLREPDCVAGAILDGFPRTPTQAQALEEMLAEFQGQVDFVPFISAPESVLVERISGRLTCRANGHIYHEKYNPPKVAGKCDLDGSVLYEREDDKAETVKNRIKVYLDQTAPLIEHYRRLNKVVDIDGTQEVDQVTLALLRSIKRA
jgi:adenylate kinase